MRHKRNLHLEETLRAGAKNFRPVPPAGFEQRLTAALARARNDTAEQTTRQPHGWRRAAPMLPALLVGGIVFALGIATQDNPRPPETIAHQPSPEIMLTPVPDMGSLTREVRQQLGLSSKMTPAQQELLATLPYVLPPALGTGVVRPLSALLSTDNNPRPETRGTNPDNGMI